MLLRVLGRACVAFHCKRHLEAKHLHAILGLKWQADIVAAKHGGSQLGLIVFQRQIQVAGTGLNQIRYFRFKPDGRKLVFQQTFDTVIEF